MTKLQHKMKTKTLISSLFAIILMTSLVFAAASLTVTGDNDAFRSNAQAQDFVITNTGDLSNFTITNAAPIGGVTFSLSDNVFTNVPNNEQRALTVTTNGNPNDLDFGVYTSTLTISSTDASNNTATSNVELTVVSGFCSAGAVGGNLSIKDFDLNNQDGDDEELELLNTIEIDVEVENLNDDEDVDEVFVELAIFDSDGNDVTNDFDFENADEEELDLGDIREGDSEEDTFTFRIPADVDDGTYRIAVKAYSDDLGESNECVDFGSDLSDEFYHQVTIDRETDDERFVIVDDIQFDSNQVSPGELVTGEFTVYNIGDEDQERVLITMKNSALGLDREFEITQDLDQGDDQTIQFSFVVPATASNGNYNIEFETFYDYRNGVYREGHEDTFLALLSVIGGTTTPIGNPSGVSITASLGSEAIAGEELIVNSVITNLGSSTATFLVDVTGYNSWAELDSVSQRIITLNAGQSANVQFVFTVNEDAEGAEGFLIETNSNGNIEVQEVEVNILGSSSGFDFGDNSLIWIIAIVNIVLILLIILVAIRLSRR